MNPFATLLNWLAPLLHPLGDFRNQVSKLATIHQSSVQTFGMLAGGLVENQAGPEAFTGELETSFWESVQAYLNAENALISAGVTAGSTGGSVATIEGIVEEASATCETCATEITGAAEVAAAEIAGDVVLDEVTGVVDAAAVAEAGANPIADVAAIILTLVAGAALLITLTKLAWDIYNAIQQWQRMMHNIADTPLANLPPNPTPVPAPTPNVSPLTRKLTIQEEHLIDKVLEDYPGVSRLDLENLIRAGYDEKSIRAFIDGEQGKQVTIEQINAMLNNIIINTKFDLPYGFKSIGDFRSFGMKLCRGLSTAGYTGVNSNLQGSAVTGVKYTTGQPFDVGRTSDFDIALASPDLLAKAKALNIPLRSQGVRTGPLNDNQLRALGLYQLSVQLSKMAGRKVSFMIYNSTLTAVNRAPSVSIPCGNN